MKTSMNNLDAGCFPVQGNGPQGSPFYILKAVNFSSNKSSLEKISQETTDGTQPTGLQYTEGNLSYVAGNCYPLDRRASHKQLHDACGFVTIHSTTRTCSDGRRKTVWGKQCKATNVKIRVC